MLSLDRHGMTQRQTDVAAIDMASEQVARGFIAHRHLAGGNDQRRLGKRLDQAARNVLGHLFFPPLRSRRT